MDTIIWPIHLAVRFFCQFRLLAVVSSEARNILWNDYPAVILFTVITVVVGVVGYGFASWFTSTLPIWIRGIVIGLVWVLVGESWRHMCSLTTEGKFRPQIGGIDLFMAFGLGIVVAEIVMAVGK